MTRRASAAAVALLALALTSSNAASQDLYDRALLRGVAKHASEALVENLDAHIKPRLKDPRHRLIARDTRIWVPLTPSDYGGIPDRSPLTFFSHGTDVVIPATSWRFFADLLYGWAWLAASQNDPRTVLEYLSMMKYQYRGLALDSAMRPHRVLGVPDNVREDSRLAEQVNWQFNGAMFFVLCHEVGHVVFGHNDTLPKSPEESHRRELAADDFALSIFRGVGQPADGILFFFLFRSVLDPYPIDGAALGSSTHPLSTERIRRVLDYVRENAASMSRIQSDPKVAEGRYRAWLSIADEVAQLIERRGTQIEWRATGMRVTPSTLGPRPMSMRSR